MSGCHSKSETAGSDVDIQRIDGRFELSDRNKVKMTDPNTNIPRMCYPMVWERLKQIVTQTPSDLSSQNCASLFRPSNFPLSPPPHLPLSLMGVFNPAHCPSHCRTYPPPPRMESFGPPRKYSNGRAPGKEKDMVGRENKA
eukprot:758941-Hanusia_phi.AAC.3